MNNPREDLYFDMAALRKRWKMPLYPFDPFLILTQLPEIELRDADFSTPGLHSLIVSDSPNGKALIVLNRRRTPMQQRLDLAHELIHYALHTSSIRSCHYSDFMEWQANEGSRELLMPRAAILQICAECRDFLRTSRDVERLISELARMFDVSDPMMICRADSLRWDIVRVLHGTSPEKVPILPVKDYPGRDIAPSLEDLREQLSIGYL